MQSRHSNFNLARFVARLTVLVSDVHFKFHLIQFFWADQKVLKIKLSRLFQDMTRIISL